MEGILGKSEDEGSKKIKEGGREGGEEGGNGTDTYFKIPTQNITNKKGNLLVFIFCVTQGWNWLP